MKPLLSPKKQTIKPSLQLSKIELSSPSLPPNVVEVEVKVTCRSRYRLLLIIVRDTVIEAVEYTKEQQLYRILVPSGHILLTFCVRIGTFDRSRVSGLVQVFRVSCIIVTSVRVQRANMDH